jgi:hypothetical protein
MHRLSPALDQCPDLLFVIVHRSAHSFDGTAPGAVGRIYRVGPLYASKIIGGALGESLLTHGR